MSMEVVQIGVGTNDNVEAQVDPTHQSGRVSVRPLEHVTGGIGGTQGGHYYTNFTTGSIAAIAAAGQIFALRWNDTSKLFVLLRLSVSAVCTAFSTGTGADLEVVRASSYTANASGGTPITPSTTSQMARQSSMASSSFGSLGELRIATTVALTAGTQTLDTTGFGACQLGATGAGGGAGPFDLYNDALLRQHPIILTNNQGLVVRAVTAVPTSNNFRYSVSMVHAELASF